MPLLADADGKILGSFLIPENMPVGARRVHAQGSGGSFANAVFVGQSVIEHQVLRQVTRIWIGYDPLAQTFQLQEPRFATGLDFVVCGIGSSTTKNPINVEIREVDNGVPNGIVIAKGTVAYDNIYIRPTLGRAPGRLDAMGWNTLGTYGIYNYGNLYPNFLRVFNSTGWGGPGRSLLKFELPAIGGATITSARLSLRKRQDWGNQAFAILASKAGANPWSNTEHSGDHWLMPNDMFVSDNRDASISLPTQNGGWFDFDVKHIVQSWADGAVNNGFCLHAANETNIPSNQMGVVEFNNDNDTVRPRLFVEWVRNPVSAPSVDGRFTRCIFDEPVFLEAGRSYAVVILTDDPKHAVGIATLGQSVGPGDGTFGYITSQPYPQGVLLSSSNAESWTIHQNSDLCFRLLGANFTANSRDIDLGNFNPQQITDFIINATTFQPTGETTVRFKVTRISTSEIFYINDNEPLTFSFRATNETFNVVAELRGTNTLSPVLFAGALFICGNLQNNGDYYTRAIDATENFNLTVNLRSSLPGSATLQVFGKVQRMVGNVEQSNNDGTPAFDWVEIPVDPLFVPRNLGNGSYERVFKRANLRGVGQERITAVKLVLTGNPANRPAVVELAAFTKLP